MSWEIRRVIVPPYCGVPRLSHQFPVTEVVVGVVVIGLVVVVVVVILVVDVVILVVVVAVVLEVVFVVQEASSIAATNKMLKPNQINLFFNYLLLLN
jgi:hypothetical protein